MSDRCVWSCRECSNAVVAGLTPPDIPCPACNEPAPYHPGELWNQEGGIR